MIIWWSKHIRVILSVLVCDIWINVLLQTSTLVGPLYIANWNARWNSQKLIMALINISPPVCRLRWDLEDRRVRSLFPPLGSHIFPFYGPYEALLAAFPVRESGEGVTLTTHLHIVPRLRMCGVISTLVIKSNPQRGLRGLEGSGRLRLPGF
jgi:hypothetical protein